jgi:HK97 family phage portal protein
MARALTFSEPETFEAGVAYTSDAPIEQSYPTVNSMAALSSFPWVRACVVAKADDIAGLSVHVERDGEVVEDHPFAETLRQPASKTEWHWWVRQAVVDYSLSGNHYSLLTGGVAGVPVSLIRWHPNDGNAVADDSGQIQGYTYREDGKSYEWSDVLHMRDIGWMQGPEGLIGEGPIRSLHADLTADLNSKRMTAKAAKRGRLEGIFSPAPTDLGVWGDDKVKEFAAAIAEWTRKPDNNGYLVLGGAAKFEAVSITPADLQSAEKAVATRDATLAVFSVPPARLSLPTANFATQQQQMKTYWEALINGPISALEDALSLAAERVGEVGDRVVFDVSGVEALQEAMAVRLERVSLHILHGIKPEVAYAMEGIEVPDNAFETLAEPAPEPETEEPEADEEEEERQLKQVPRTEQERADRWRHFIRAVHRPAVLRLNLAASRYLSQAAERYIRRLEEVAARAGFQRTGTDDIDARGLSDRQIEEVLSELQEFEAALSALEPAMRAALVSSFRANASRIGESLTFNEANSVLSDMAAAAVRAITNTQSNAMRSIVAGLDEGLTVSELQEQLIRSRAFSPRRALTIARTEATRFVNAGADEAISTAAAEGILVRKQWLTARDGEVRRAHVELDGDTVGHGEQFTSGSHHASFPGGFGVASLDANCRCTVIPVVGATSS